MAGPGPWFGDVKFMRGPRVKRGDVRAAALALLAEEPRNGYQIIQEIGERSGGVWRPSPGGRRRYALTTDGETYVAEHPEEIRAPWDIVARSVGDGAIEVRDLIGQLAMAAVQVVRVGDETQVAQAHKILTDARRSLYRILAADDEEPAGEQEAAGEH
jgi:DNA-binding PadR family transcriptional regulator